MTARRRLTGVFLLVMLCGACATTLPSHYDYDPSVDLSGYRTWYWLTDDRSIMPADRQPELSPLILQRIADYIEQHLGERGFAMAASREQADFVVTFTVGTREKIQIESYPFHYRGPWYWQPYYWDSHYEARTYTVGTLAIDVFDQRSRAPVWHGWTSKRVTTRDLEAPDEPVHRAVEAVLLNFPPPATPDPGKPEESK